MSRFIDCVDVSRDKDGNTVLTPRRVPVSYLTTREVLESFSEAQKKRIRAASPAIIETLLSGEGVSWDVYETQVRLLAKAGLFSDSELLELVGESE